MSIIKEKELNHINNVRKELFTLIDNFLRNSDSIEERCFFNIDVTHLTRECVNKIVHEISSNFARCLYKRKKSSSYVYIMLSDDSREIEEQNDYPYQYMIQIKNATLSFEDLKSALEVEVDISELLSFKEQTKNK